ncbi:hypothetical protein Celaphus_00007603 [Cervus elaphus hippelaphus]|uniref:Cystatin domain-containing protein n=1 Tax=Cervus elaphus hippelaphus TaxID=46360 RepID=A0A212CAN1_CEREH|nr:hypothetical protein Celaphus_00007603 [Cervus elaphus hippelaphus]
MGAGRWGNPLLLLAALVLVLGRHQQWPGFQDSESPKNVNATLAFLLENYNNNSNDSYLFGVDRLLRSQVQDERETGKKPPVAAAVEQVQSKDWASHIPGGDQGALGILQQLTTGVEYLITVKLSRTKCKRNSTKKRSCPIQTKKNLKKSFICDFLVYTLPWMNHYQLWNNSCLDE